MQTRPQLRFNCRIESAVTKLQDGTSERLTCVDHEIIGEVLDPSGHGVAP